MASSKPASTSTPYLAYILRMWATDRGEAARWQASLEDPSTGRRIGFANLEELFIFLMERGMLQGIKRRAENDAAGSPAGVSSPS